MVEQTVLEEFWSPDPIYAFRFFYNRNNRVEPLNTPFADKHVYEVGGDYEAVCGYDIGKAHHVGEFPYLSHDALADMRNGFARSRCQQGFYAYRLDLPTLGNAPLENMLTMKSYIADMLTANEYIALVSLYGTVLETEYGYRATNMHIHELVSVRYNKFLLWFTRHRLSDWLPDSVYTALCNRLEYSALRDIYKQIEEWRKEYYG